MHQQEPSARARGTRDRKGANVKPALGGISLEKPLSLAALVAQQIKDAIVEARLQLGEALSEDKIAASMQVSRTPVREALNMLQMQGLIDILPKTGSFVFRPSTRDIAALADYRSMLEQNSMARALEVAPEALLKDLKKALSAMTKAATAKDPNEYARADDLFHAASFVHCDNHYLEDAYNAVSGRIAALRSHLAGPLKLYQTQTYEEHQEILDAVADKDGDRLRALVANHIAVMRQNYVKALDDGLLQLPQARTRSKGPKGTNVRSQAGQRTSVQA